MAVAPTVKLNSGYEMPMIGLGTYLSTDYDVKSAVKSAISSGYRLIDTAYMYKNEKQIGDAIREEISAGKIKRSEICVVSKLWNIFHDPENVEKTCRKSLENLGMDYIDIYLMHYPIGYEYSESEDLIPKDSAGNIKFSDVDYVSTWKAMEDLVTLGLVKNIGVSNFNSEQLERLLNNSTIKPVVLQVECNTGINQKNLIKFCKERDIYVQAYSPMGRPHYHQKNNKLPKPVLFDVGVQKIAEKYNKSTGQIILKYLVSNGAIPIPKSGHAERIKNNIEIFDFELTQTELEFMDKFNSGERTVPCEAMKSHKYFPFNIPF
ncbi:unnamed protein product [Diamesa serratosioi]